MLSRTPKPADDRLRTEPPPVSPPTLPPDFPDVPQNAYSELQPPPPRDATPDKVAGAMPTEGEAALIAEPSEDQILQEAKELCRDDEKAWDREDSLGQAGGTIVTDSDRTEYLKRAKSRLQQR
jgi:hypothetical protein